MPREAPDIRPKAIPVVTAQQVAAAEGELARLETLLAHNAFGSHTDQMLRRLRTESAQIRTEYAVKTNAVNELAAQIESWKGELGRLKWQVSLCHNLTAASVGLVIGAAGLVFGLFVAVILCMNDCFRAAALSGLVSFCFTSLAYVLWQHHGRDWLRDTAARLQAGAAAKNAQIEQARPSLLAAEQCRVEAQRAVALRREADTQVEHAIDLRERLMKLRSEIDRLKAAVGARQYALLRQSWDRMAGTEFEEFLREVFEVLGYGVQLTKGSGDNGVDLIVTKRGVRVAVQAKRHGTNVSNGAVQEAHTGMVFYDCQFCAVVTNSQFTKQAIDLARKVNCVLISGTDLPGLFRGNARPWNHCIRCAA